MFDSYAAISHPRIGYRGAALPVRLTRYWNHKKRSFSSGEFLQTSEKILTKIAVRNWLRSPAWASYCTIHLRNSRDDFLQNRSVPLLCATTKLGRAYSWPYARYGGKPKCSVSVNLSNQRTPKLSHRQRRFRCLDVCRRRERRRWQPFGQCRNNLQLNARKTPRLSNLYFDVIAIDRRGEIPKGMSPFMTIPLLCWYESKLTVFSTPIYRQRAALWQGITIDQNAQRSLRWFWSSRQRSIASYQKLSGTRGYAICL